ncbi:ATPase [Methylophaga sp. OBS4]|uniref:ATPase n=1 Tax=Methylophaga sp. OBS4 TaxID=2991935 RepID=UPI002253FE76|nr:ATPase [Methylophaga sp. OBS4]MCX4186932.1 ATPase [Methylophaga sp. OBS4]
MQVESIKDILEWTVHFHHELAACLKDCTDKNENARAKLLLGYLATHEKTLENMVAEFERTANLNALNTWCYEYLDKHPVIKHKHSDVPFSKLDTKQIMETVTQLHEQVIDLYQDLYDRAPVESEKELLKQLLDVEDHEAMRISQSANRLEDL